MFFIPKDFIQIIQLLINKKQMKYITFIHFRLIILIPDLLNLASQANYNLFMNYHEFLKISIQNKFLKDFHSN